MARNGFDANLQEVKCPKELVFHESLRRNVKRFPDRLAVVFEDNRYTHKEFNANVNSLTSALVGHSSDVWLMASYGTSKVGTPCIPMNFRIVGPEIEYTVNHNDSVVLFIGRRHTRKPRLAGGVQGRNIMKLYRAGKPRPVGGELQYGGQDSRS